MVDIEYMGKCLLIRQMEKNTIVVGDLHLGYEEALNKAGIFVSRKMFVEMIEYFDKFFDRVGKVEEIVLLGDVKHDFGSILRQEWEDTLNLVKYFKQKSKKVIIIKGNHDKIVEQLAKKGDVKVVDYYIDGEICFIHGERDFEEIHNKKIKYWILGHGHPAVVLKDGVKEEKYKCFLSGKYEGKEIVIVPSFIEHNEGSDPREHDLGLAWNFQLEKFKVRVIGENLQVFEFGNLRKL